MLGCIAETASVYALTLRRGGCASHAADVYMDFTSILHRKDGFFPDIIVHLWQEGWKL